MTAEKESGRVASPFLLSRSRVKGSLLLAEHPAAAVLGLINWRCMSRQCTLADRTVDLDIVLALPFRPSRVTSAQSGTIQFQTGGDCAGSEIERWAGDKIHKLIKGDVCADGCCVPQAATGGSRLPSLRITV